MPDNNEIEEKKVEEKKVEEKKETKFNVGYFFSNVFPSLICL